MPVFEALGYPLTGLLYDIFLAFFTFGFSMAGDCGSMLSESMLSPLGVLATAFVAASFGYTDSAITVYLSVND